MSEIYEQKQRIFKILTSATLQGIEDELKNVMQSYKNVRIYGSVELLGSNYVILVSYE